MPSFIDLTCGKCKRRYGWCGELTDCKPCPSCGWKPDPKEMAKDEAMMKEAEKKLFGDD
jgi:hypothetical protein